MPFTKPSHGLDELLGITLDELGTALEEELLGIELEEEGFDELELAMELELKIEEELETEELLELLCLLDEEDLFSLGELELIK